MSLSKPWGFRDWGKNHEQTGVQIFISTHDYAVLKEFDLKYQDQDQPTFHSLFRDTESDEIKAAATPLLYGYLSQCH